MYHLVPITCLVLLTFGVLVLRYRVEVAYILLAGFPTLTVTFCRCWNRSHLTSSNKAQANDSCVNSNHDRLNSVRLYLHYAAMIVCSYVRALETR